MNTFEAEDHSYQAMLQLHEYVTETLGQKSIIMDADELKQNPGRAENHSTFNIAYYFSVMNVKLIEGDHEVTVPVSRSRITPRGCSAGFCIALLGRHRDTLTLCSTHFTPNPTLSSTEFEPKSIPYLVQM